MEITRCYYKLGEFENAINWNDKILRLNPNDEKALLATKN